MTVTQKVRQRAVQQRAEETQEAILLAAVELFTTQGFDGISIKAIEQASGTKRGLVTYHFGDKEQLWRLVADHVFAQLALAKQRPMHLGPPFHRGTLRPPKPPWLLFQPL